MNKFLRRSGSDLEAHLRIARPRPSSDLVSAITGQLRPGHDRRRSARIGAALAAAGLVLVAFGAGGAGYAYSSSSTSAHRSAGVHLNQKNVIKRPSSSSDSQYGPVQVPPYPPPCDCSSPPAASPPPPANPGGTTSGGGTSAGHTAGHSSGSSTGTSGTPNVAGGGFTQVKSGGGNLPFTGMSLAFPVVIGAVLIVLGLAVRRKARPKEQ